MDQYTEKAKEALALAAEAAENMGVRMVGTEHILVGLIQEGSGTAARVLEANAFLRRYDALSASLQELDSQAEDCRAQTQDLLARRAQEQAQSAQAEEEVNRLAWLDVEEDFFDRTRFAGHGNIGHMYAILQSYGPGFFHAQKIHQAEASER